MVHPRTPLRLVADVMGPDHTTPCVSGSWGGADMTIHRALRALWRSALSGFGGRLLRIDLVGGLDCCAVEGGAPVDGFDLGGIQDDTRGPVGAVRIGR
jgi:hypothetical protein